MSTSPFTIIADSQDEGFRRRPRRRAGGLSRLNRSISDSATVGSSITGWGRLELSGMSRLGSYRRVNASRPACFSSSNFARQSAGGPGVGLVAEGRQDVGVLVAAQAVGVVVVDVDRRPDLPTLVVRRQDREGPDRHRAVAEQQAGSLGSLAGVDRGRRRSPARSRVARPGGRARRS